MCTAGHQISSTDDVNVSVSKLKKWDKKLSRTFWIEESYFTQFALFILGQGNFLNTDISQGSVV